MSDTENISAQKEGDEVEVVEKPVKPTKPIRPKRASVAVSRVVLGQERVNG